MTPLSSHYLILSGKAVNVGQVRFVNFTQKSKNLPPHCFLHLLPTYSLVFLDPLCCSLSLIILFPQILHCHWMLVLIGRHTCCLRLRSALITPDSIITIPQVLILAKFVSPLPHVSLLLGSCLHLQLDMKELYAKIIESLGNLVLNAATLWICWVCFFFVFGTMGV